MNPRKKIFAIVGSASKHSANEHLLKFIAQQLCNEFDVFIFNELKLLPHFDPEATIDNPPKSVADFRNKINEANGIIICTPEYVFSIPSGLKNAIEWCVATTVFSDKPVGLITASAHGAKGHEELQLIMRTIMTKFTDETTLLIQGIKGKIDEQGEMVDSETTKQLMKFVESFRRLILN